MKKIIKISLFVLLSFGLSYLAGEIGGRDTGIVTASVLGVLITGAGVQTTFSGQSQCEEYIVIGDVDTPNALRGLSVEIDGTPFINIQNSAPLISAFQKWQMETCGAAVGLMLKVATGNISRNTTYRFTNDGVTTPTVRVFSDSKNGIPILATTKSINASSFEDFSKFSSLLLSLPANVSSVEVVFADGHKSTMTIEEVDALFALKNQSEADGRLAGVSVIDNTDQSIQSVRIFAGAASVTVLIAKLPNDAFAALK
jgi:hypothetical protein